MSFSYTQIDNPAGLGPFTFIPTYSEASEIVVFGYNGKTWGPLSVASVTEQTVTLNESTTGLVSIRISNNASKVNHLLTNGNDGNLLDVSSSLHDDLQIKTEDKTDPTGSCPLTPENITVGGLRDYIVEEGGGTTGFVDYNDATGSVSLTADTWTDVPNNGAGVYTNTTYKPDGITTLLDTSTGYLDFSELTLGSEIFVRNDFTINPNTNNALLEARYLLGGGAGEYPLMFWSERLDSGSGINYQRVVPFPLYMGDLNTRDNVGRLQVKLSTSGTLTNAGNYISIRLK